jgi:hypothetical protein
MSVEAWCQCQLQRLEHSGRWETDEPNPLYSTTTSFTVDHGYVIINIDTMVSCQPSSQNVCIVVSRSCHKLYHPAYPYRLTYIPNELFKKQLQ